MRNWKGRTYHCSADEAGADHHLSYYDDMHKKRGFRKIGYHFLVHPDGKIDIGRTLDEVGAHARGYNSKYVGVCYIGGLLNGKPHDTRTTAQIHALRALDAVLTSIGVGEEKMGHRDLSVDLNGDGVISKDEWMKACPCFDVKTDF